MLSNGTHNAHVLQRNARGYVNKKEIHTKSHLPAIDNRVYGLCIDRRGLLRLFPLVLLKTTREESKMSNFHTTLSK